MVIGRSVARRCLERAVAVVLAALFAFAGGAIARRAIKGAEGVVNHRVGNDAYTRCLASGDHGFELRLRAELRIELVAGNLVRSPPLLALDRLLRRGNFDVSYTFRTVDVGALPSHRFPVLLECDDDDVLRSRLRRFPALRRIRRRSEAGERQRGADAKRGYPSDCGAKPFQVHMLHDHVSFHVLH